EQVQQDTVGQLVERSRAEQDAHQHSQSRKRPHDSQAVHESHGDGAVMLLFRLLLKEADGDWNHRKDTGSEQRRKSGQNRRHEEKRQALRPQLSLLVSIRITESPYLARHVARRASDTTRRRESLWTFPPGSFASSSGDFDASSGTELVDGFPGAR